MPWQRTLPPSAAEFAPSEHIGQLYAFAIGGYVASQATPFGERSAVRCTLIQLDGPSPGEIVADALMFNSRMVGRFRGAVGQIHLGRFVYGEGKGANAPIDVADATADDEAIATRYVQAFPGQMEKLLAEVIESHRMSESRMQGQGQQQRPQQNQGWQGQGAQQQRHSDWRQTQGAGQAQANPAPSAPPWSGAPQSEEPPF